MYFPAYSSEFLGLNVAKNVQIYVLTNIVKEYKNFVFSLYKSISKIFISDILHDTKNISVTETELDVSI